MHYVVVAKVRSSLSIRSEKRTALAAQWESLWLARQERLTLSHSKWHDRSVGIQTYLWYGIVSATSVEALAQIVDPSPPNSVA